MQCWSFPSVSLWMNCLTPFVPLKTGKTVNAIKQTEAIKICSYKPMKGFFDNSHVIFSYISNAENVQNFDIWIIRIILVIG